MTNKMQVLFLFCRKSLTSVLSVPSHFQRLEIWRVICTCTTGCGRSGVTFVVADSASPPISRITCYCTSVDVPTRSTWNPCQMDNLFLSFFSFLPIACFFFWTHTLLLLLFIVYFIFPTNYAKEIPCENLQITNNIESFKVL